jgi:hypothetical protein
MQTHLLQALTALETRRLGSKHSYVLPEIIIKFVNKLKYQRFIIP